MTNMSIQVGMNARLFPNNWRPVREEIAFAREHGFACLQLPGTERGLDAERLGDSIEMVGALLHASGVGVVMEMLIRIGPDGRTEAGVTPLDVLRANLPAIIALGCSPVHWHLIPTGPRDPATLRVLEETFVPQLAEAMVIADGQDFGIGIEQNEQRIPFFATAERCAAMIARVPGLGLVWDLNHTHPAAFDGYLALAPHMSMLHVSDTPLPETNHHLPLGCGTIDFAHCTRELLARGFCGRAILEIGGLPKSGGFGQDTDAALIDSRARLLAAIGVGHV